MATVGTPGVGTQPTFATDPSKYTTIHDLLDVNKHDNRDLLIKTYGDQGITGFLELTGATKSAGTNDFVQYWEEERRHRLVALTGTAPSGTGGTVTLGTPLSGDNILEGQTVVMNAESGEVFICTTASTVFKRLDGTTSNTAWAATDSLIILGNMYDQGSPAPENFMKTDATKRNNSFMIIKDLYEVNGSQATNIGWVNVGGDYRWYIHGEQETRKRFLDKREMMMLFGQLTGADSSTIATNNGGVAGSKVTSQLSMTEVSRLPTAALILSTLLLSSTTSSLSSTSRALLLSTPCTSTELRTWLSTTCLLLVSLLLLPLVFQVSSVHSRTHQIWPFSLDSRASLAVDTRSTSTTGSC